MIFVFFVWLKKTLRSFGDLLTWVFALCFLLGCLCFVSCLGGCVLLLAWVFALRAGFLNVNCRQWPLMFVNVFLACFARYDR